MIVHLSEHERFTLRRAMEFVSASCEDLLKPDRRLTDIRRGAWFASVLVVLADAVDSGDLDTEARGVAEWAAYNREQALGVLADCGEVPPDDADQLLDEIALCGRLAVS